MARPTRNHQPLKDGLRVSIGTSTLELRVDNQLATVFIDGAESSCINLSDPTALEFEYMQQMTAAMSVLFPFGPVRALHLGAAACCLPLAWHHLRPGSQQVAVEINADLARVVRNLFDLPRSPHLKIRVADAREALNQYAPGRFDVIVRDVFTDAHTPQNLRSKQFFETAQRVLSPTGVLLVNAAHGKGVDARTDVAGALATFEHVAICAESKVLSGGRRGNVCIIALNEPPADSFQLLQRELRKLAFTPRFLETSKARRWVGTSQPVTDIR